MSATAPPRRRWQWAVGLCGGLARGALVIGPSKGYTCVVLKVLRESPQPLRTLLYLFTAAILINFVLVAVSRQSAGIVATGVLGAAIGMVLATDLRGNARAYSALLRRTRVWGVDYSRSPMVSVAGVRLMGVAYVVIGVVFVVAGARGQ